VVAEGLKGLLRHSACKSRPGARDSLNFYVRWKLVFAGRHNFLSRASGQIAIAIENACAYHEISQLKDKLAQEKLYLEEEIRSEMNFENIIGNSPALKHVLETR